MGLISEKRLLNKEQVHHFFCFQKTDKILGFLYETFKSKIFAARAHWGIVRRLVKNLVHVHRILPRDGSQKIKAQNNFFDYPSEFLFKKKYIGDSS